MSMCVKMCVKIEKVHRPECWYRMAQDFTNILPIYVKTVFFQIIAIAIYVKTVPVLGFQIDCIYTDRLIFFYRIDKVHRPGCWRLLFVKQNTILLNVWGRIHKHFIWSIFLLHKYYQQFTFKIDSVFTHGQANIYLRCEDYTKERHEFGSILTASLGGQHRQQGPSHKVSLCISDC